MKIDIFQVIENVGIRFVLGFFGLTLLYLLGCIIYTILVNPIVFLTILGVTVLSYTIGWIIMKVYNLD